MTALNRIFYFVSKLKRKLTAGVTANLDIIATLSCSGHFSRDSISSETSCPPIPIRFILTKATKTTDISIVLGKENKFNCCFLIQLQFFLLTEQNSTHVKRSLIWAFGDNDVIFIRQPPGGQTFCCTCALCSVLLRATKRCISFHFKFNTCPS